MKSFTTTFLGVCILLCSCGTNNDTPEPPSSSRIDYYIDYEIDGKKEKYIIDTGHLNTDPFQTAFSIGNWGFMYNITYDAINPVVGNHQPITPFGKSVLTQTVYPNLSLTMTIKNFSALKAGDVIQIDSSSLEPYGTAVGIAYVPKAPPFNDSIVDYYDLGLNPLKVQGGSLAIINENLTIKGKNGTIKIISKSLHTTPAGRKYYILNGEINGDFMKFYLITQPNGKGRRVNRSYKSGTVKFQLPFAVL